jgi:hypothetical protein
MKKLIAIAIVLIYVTSFTEVHQFFKIPVLWQHYLEHQQKDNTITFLQYLSHHYETHDDHDDDHDRDKELPFKDFEHCAFVQAMTLPTDKLELKLENYIFKKIYACYYNKFITAFHLTEIWQPPKI